MNEINWSQLWQDSQADPYLRAALALMLLNGLEIKQIKGLAQATISPSGHWITTDDGHTIPLALTARDALMRLFEEESRLSTDRLDEVAATLEVLEHDAHRVLAGAIWLTNEDNSMMLDLVGSQETPILPLRFSFPFSVTERLQPDDASEVTHDAQRVLNTAASWLEEQLLVNDVSLLKKVLGLLRQGSLIFLLVSTGISGLNLIHNVLMGRLLSPADYSQLTFIITLQLLIGLLPTAIQTVVARFSARYEAQQEVSLLSLLLQRGVRFSWMMGIGVGIILLVGSPLLVSFFQLNDLGVLLPVVIAVPFFVRMGVDRGFLQGIGSYYWLSAGYLTEGVLRLGVSVVLGYALLAAGRSLEGAVWGLAESMIASWFVTWLALRHFRAKTDETATEQHQAEWVRLGGMTAMVLVGQALITNSDFLIVKNFFTPEDAGLYAAVSVLGRIVYFGALPLTILLVPIIARRQALNEPTRPILMLLLGGGVVVCSTLVVIATIFAPNVLDLLYGEAYIAAAALLAPYALAASLYTLTNLVVTYQIALGSGGETWMPILAGTAQIIGVLLFHESLAQVITIQIVLMGLLFVAVLWRVLRREKSLLALPEPVLELPG